MNKLLPILLFSLLIPNVTNNGADVSISEDVTVDIIGDLILNSGSIDLSGNLNVSGQLIENGGTLSGTGNYNGNILLSIGDLNDDGLLNILDIITVANIAVDILPYDESADLTGDGQVNILDVIFIVNLVLNS